MRVLEGFEGPAPPGANAGTTQAADPFEGPCACARRGHVWQPHQGRPLEQPAARRDHAGCAPGPGHARLHPRAQLEPLRTRPCTGCWVLGARSNSRAAPLRARAVSLHARSLHLHAHLVTRADAHRTGARGRGTSGGVRDRNAVPHTHCLRLRSDMHGAAGGAAGVQRAVETAVVRGEHSAGPCVGFGHSHLCPLFLTCYSLGRRRRGGCAGRGEVDGGARRGRLS